MYTWCCFSLAANNGWTLGTIKRSAILTSTLKALVKCSRSWALKRSRCCRRCLEIVNRVESRVVGNRLTDDCCCKDGDIAGSLVLESKLFRMDNGGAGVSLSSQWVALSSSLVCFLFLEALLSVITCEREMCNALGWSLRLFGSFWHCSLYQDMHVHKDHLFVWITVSGIIHTRSHSLFLLIEI